MNNYERAAVLDNAQPFIIYIYISNQRLKTLLDCSQICNWVVVISQMNPLLNLNQVTLANLSYVDECFYYFLWFSHWELSTILLTLEIDWSKKHNLSLKIVILKNKLCFIEISNCNDQALNE